MACWWPCCGDETYGYVCGGLFIGMSKVADKVAFSAETVTATTTANLSVARGQFPPGVANPGIAAYFCGGLSAISTASKIADKLVFSTDATTATTTADLDNIQSHLAAISERSSKGYYAGGSTVGNPITNITATGHILTFSGDTNTATTTIDLSQARYNLTGLTEGTSKGYWLGGNTGAARVATADKIVFSSDTTSAQTTANLSQARSDLQSTSDGSTYGYILGGRTTGDVLVGTVDRLTFSTDATAVRTTMVLNRSAGAGMSDGVLAIVGGFDGSSSTGLDKLTFSTEIISSFAGSLSASRNYYGMAAQAGL